jgi:hypothetical protein
MPQCFKDYGKSKEISIRTYKSVKSFLRCIVKIKTLRTLIQVNSTLALFKLKTNLIVKLSKNKRKLIN